MKFLKISTLSLCLLLTLLGLNLSAQPFQKLHAFDNGTDTIPGTYKDVVSLSAPGPNGEEVVAVGHTSTQPKTGVVSFSDLATNMVSIFEVSDQAGNDLLAKAVTEVPGGDIVACFFDPVAAETEVIRMQNSGVILWRRRLPAFEAMDVIAEPNITATGGEAIFLTGDRLGGGPTRLALHALDGGGNTLFANHYTFAGSNGYVRTSGQKLIYNSSNSRITIAGFAKVSACPVRELLVVQTSTAGAIIWAKGYEDFNGNVSFQGMGIEHSVNFPNGYAIAMRRTNETTGQSQSAMLHIAPSGFPLWVRYFQPVTTYAGDDFRITGLDSDGETYLLSGTYDPYSTPAGQYSGFSMEVQEIGAINNFNEYETGSYWPGQGTYLMDLFYNPANETHYLVGEFNSYVTAGTWPQGANPKSFWMVATDTSGAPQCGSATGPTAYTPEINKVNLTHNSFNMAQALTSDPNVAQQQPVFRNQCTAAKTFGAQPAAEPALSWLDVSESIQVEVPVELEGMGQIQVLDLQGRILADFSASAGEHLIDASNWVSGVYLVRYNFPGSGAGAKKIFVR